MFLIPADPRAPCSLSASRARSDTLLRCEGQERVRDVTGAVALYEWRGAPCWHTQHSAGHFTLHHLHQFRCSKTFCLMPRIKCYYYYLTGKGVWEISWLCDTSTWALNTGAARTVSQSQSLSARQSFWTCWGRGFAVTELDLAEDIETIETNSIIGSVVYFRCVNNTFSR